MGGKARGEGLRGARTLGVVSDTHGQLRGGLFRHLKDVDLVLHAGDVVVEDHLEDLAALAPVRAVWGNMDGAELRRRLPEEMELRTGGYIMAMRHGHQGVDAGELTTRFPRAQVIVHGHTHEPRWEERAGSFLLNPGSAGPRRRGKPVTAARLSLEGEKPEVEFLQLAD